MIVLRCKTIFGGCPRAIFSKKNSTSPLIDNSEFQREFGLDKQMEVLNKKVAREEKLSEWKYGLPIAIFAGISLFFLISGDQNDSNNMKLWLKLHHRKLKYSIFPTPASSKQLFECYYEYSTKGTGREVLLQDIVGYLDRNEVTVDMLPKLEEIVLRIHSLIKTKPTALTMGLVQKLLNKSFQKEQQLMGLKYNQKLAGLCVNFGNLEQQYLGLLINPHQHISQTAINKLNSNLEAYENMLDIDLESIKLKNNLNRKQVLCILSKILKESPEMMGKVKMGHQCRKKLLEG